MSAGSTNKLFLCDTNIIRNGSFVRNRFQFRESVTLLQRITSRQPVTEASEFDNPTSRLIDTHPHELDARACPSGRHRHQLQLRTPPPPPPSTSTAAAAPTTTTTSDSHSQSNLIRLFPSVSLRPHTTAKTSAANRTRPALHLRLRQIHIAIAMHALSPTALHLESNHHCR